MDIVLNLFCGVGFFLIWSILWFARRAIRATTLVSAWLLLCAATGLWTAAWVISNSPFHFSADARELIWYAVAVLGVCPLISVLGARRPVSRLWPMFVVLPLVAVLSWPAFAAWSDGLHGQPLEVDLPVVVGFSFVVLMGAGNYLGTRFSWVSLLFAIALVLLVLSFSPDVPGPSPHRMRNFATAIVGSAGFAAWCSARRRGSRIDPLDQLWIDFRDAIGVVWAKRLADRVNATARAENWPTRLDLQGFRRETKEPLQPADRIEQTLRWLLRRFVDDDWIDQRLREKPATEKDSD